MDINKVCDLLSLMNANKPSEYKKDLFALLSQNIENVTEQLNLDKNFAQDEGGTDTAVDKYIEINLELLNRLKSKLSDTSDNLNLLSVQQNKTIRDALRELISLGIRYNLQPNLPQRLEPASQSYIVEPKTLTTDYDRLCTTTRALIELLTCDSLRPLVVFAGIESILNALYQIVYCPLKRPQEGQEGSNTTGVTEKLYLKFLQDKKEFALLLERCGTLLPKSIYAKETMLLLKSECTWFRRAVSNNLTQLLRAANGVRLIVNALIENSRDYDPTDTTKSWRAQDLVVKLIASLRDAPDFESNICAQIVALIHANEAPAPRSYELIYVACAKHFYASDVDLFRRQFLSPIAEPLRRFTIGTAHKFENNHDVTDALQRTMRLLKLIFVDSGMNEGVALPYGELTPLIVVILRVYAAMINVGDAQRTLMTMRNAAEEIALNYLQRECGAIEHMLDAYLFGIKAETAIAPFISDAALQCADDKMTITTAARDINRASDRAVLAHALLKLARKQSSRADFEIKFFLYLLNCLVDKSRYCAANDDAAIAKNLFIYNLLSSLADDGNVQRRIGERPQEIIAYAEGVLIDAIRSGVHKRVDAFETTDFQTIFLLIMILQALTAIATTADVYAGVLRPLRTIRDECVNEELSKLVTSVINAMEGHRADADSDKNAPGGSGNGSMGEDAAQSEFDKAIDDVCDPLLPVRGHGLMILAQLIEQRDTVAMERKIFVLNIFQQNIKNQDSFIYLAAIHGMSIMADMFPDIVLETLTDEYVGFDQTTVVGGTTTGRADSDGLVEIRMKLGEVLVKVTRNLGDRAPKYKSLLLNTFMAGAKDEDHMMRASSLSNLGEICRVLAYKLGSIINEVLDCVHGAINGDPVVEARRAAVTVIRQLFVGLERTTLVFLQDDILDVYRTLKRIYTHDADGVMRLQAQLALEELNANVLAYLMPGLSVQDDATTAIKDNSGSH